MGCFDLALMVLCLMLACLPCSFDEITLSGRSGSWQGPSFDTPRPMVDDERKDDGRRTITFFSWGTGHASRTISVRMNATGLTRRDRTTCTKLETRKTKQSFIYASFGGGECACTGIFYDRRSWRHLGVDGKMRAVGNVGIYDATELYTCY
jgi:hypothetical protein